MLLESITSAMPPNNEGGEEDEGLSEDNEREQEVWSEDINATQDGKEATKNCEDIVEEPKKGMTFDTSEDAYLFYCRLVIARAQEHYTQKKKTLKFKFSEHHTCVKILGKKTKNNP